MKRHLKTKIFIAILFFLSIVGIVLLKNIFLGNRYLFEKMISFVPSDILILYRFEGLKTFILLSGFMFINFILWCSGLFWLLHSSVKYKHGFFKIKKIIIIFFLIFLCVPSTYSFRWLQSRIFFTEGYKKFQMRQDQEALNLYTKSIKSSPTFSLPCLALMNYYYQADQLKEALHVGENFLDKKNDFKILKFMGIISTAIFDYQSGIEYFNRALTLKASPDIDYELAKIYFTMSDYEQCEAICQRYPSQSRFSLLYAKSLFEKSLFQESLHMVSNALLWDDCDPEAWFLQGKIYLSMSLFAEALTSFEKVIWIKKESPDAYIQMANIYRQMEQIEKCISCLEKAVYFDNVNSEAYVRLQFLKKFKRDPIESIHCDENIFIDSFSDTIHLDKNKSINLDIRFQFPYSLENINIECIEPYGWGVLCEWVATEISNNHQFTARLKITGNRDNRINLGNLWTVNIVAYDQKTGSYNDHIVHVNVCDQEPGQILFLITEDFECTEGPHQNDATPHRKDLSIQETDTDLIRKGSLADSLANGYHIKWSHIVDLGSAFIRLKWLADVSEDSGWQQIWSQIKTFHSHSLTRGNDIQLHIHAYNVPEAPNFSQQYDHETNHLILDTSTPFPDGHYGAWANTYKDLGYYDDPASRMGSISNGVRYYEDLLHEISPVYRVLFFRAGEWEFGLSEKEMRKSVIALRKNKIFAGSDAYEGNFGSRNFIFNKRIGDNVYFSSFSDIRKPARSLLDIGILQILPIPELHHFSHVRPVDPAESVIRTADLCIGENGDVQPGVHLLVEMYHIDRINFGDRYWDSMNLDYRDWKRLKTHFKEIDENLKNVRFVTISEAVIEYLDYHAPDIIALRTNEHKIDDQTYSYEIKLIGKDIVIDEAHPHFLSIKPPSYFMESLDAVTLFHDNKRIKTWDNIQSYEDLEFIADSPSGYKLIVKTVYDDS